MENRFNQQKEFALKRLDDALKKNEVDRVILPLINFINSLDDFYTTSTCSGRISLFQYVKSKLDSYHVKKWHSQVEFNEIKKLTENLPKNGTTRLIQEPGIMHVVAKTLNKGKFILELALSSGFKHSGVQGFKDGRILVEIFNSERIDVPIAERGGVLVNEDYLSYLVELSNERFLKSQKTLKNFEDVLKREIKVKE